MPQIPTFDSPIARPAAAPVVVDYQSRLASAVKKYTNPSSASFQASLDSASPGAVRGLQNVDARRLSSGGRALSQPVSAVGLRAATAERTQVGDPETGFFGDVQRNFGELVRGLPKLPGALYNEVYDLPRALNEDLPAALAAGRGNPVETFGNVANTGGFRMIPGAYVAGSFGTDMGGTDRIVDNPLFTALDVLPYASKAAGATRTVRAAESIARPGTRVGKYGTLARYARRGGPEILPGGGKNLAGETIDVLRPNVVGEQLTRVGDASRRTKMGGLASQAFGAPSRRAARIVNRQEAAVNVQEKANAADRRLLEGNAELGRLSETIGLDRQTALTRQLERDMPESAIARLPVDEQNYVRGVIEIQKERTQQLLDAAATDPNNALTAVDITYPSGKVASEMYPTKVADKILKARDRSAKAKILRDSHDGLAAALDVSVQPGVTSATWVPDNLNRVLDSAISPKDKFAAIRAELTAAQLAGYDVASARVALLKSGRQTRASFDLFADAYRNGTIQIRPPAGGISYSPFQDVNSLIRPLRSMARTDGKVAQFIKSVQEGNWGAASREAKQVSKRTVNLGGHAWDEMLKEVRLRNNVAKDLRRADRAMSESTLTDLVNTAKKLEEAPARWSENITDEIKVRLSQQLADLQAKGELSTAEAARAAEALTDGIIRDFTDVSPLLGPLKARISSDVGKTWQELADLGMEPHYVPRTSGRKAASASARITPGAMTVESVRARVLDFAPNVDNVAVSMNRQALQMLSVRGTRATYAELDVAMGRSFTELSAQYRDFARQSFDQSKSKILTPTEILDQLIARDWTKTSYQGVVDEATGRIGSIETYLPRSLAANLDRLIPSELGLVGSLLDPVMRVFRTSLLPLSPRWHVYNIVGGAIMVTASQGPGVWLQLGKAYRETKAGSPNLMNVRELPLMGGGKAGRALREEQQWARGVNSLKTPSQKAVALWDMSSGNFLSRIWDSVQVAKAREKGSAFIDWSYAKNEMFDDMYRSMAYMHGFDKALSKGMTREAAEAVGVSKARTVLQNWDEMTPLERSIIRNVFPFYSWARHILRYSFQFPFDHPLRTAVTASLVRAELEDFNTGLPQAFSSLLNVSGVRDKLFGESEDEVYLNLDGFNPFRDMASYGTMIAFVGSAGQTRGTDLGVVTSQMNPALQYMMSSVGVDPSEGLPDPYADVAFDPVSGGLVNVNSFNSLTGLPQAVVPQSKILFDLAGMNRDYQRLVASNPDAARRRLYTSVGIPAAFTPRGVDTEAEVVKTETRRYENLSRTVSTAMRTRNFGLLDAYSHLPAVARLKARLEAADRSGELDDMTPPSQQDIAKVLDGTPTRSRVSARPRVSALTP